MGLIERTTLYRVMLNGDYPVPTNVERKLVIPVEAAEMKRLGYVPAEQLRGAVEALRSLRAAWDEHMKMCPQHANVPSFEEIDAWMKAPSNTASGGQ
jgi:hypothetical protein